jgi:hypothetical protein
VVRELIIFHRGSQLSDNLVLVVTSQVVVAEVRPELQVAVDLVVAVQAAVRQLDKLLQAQQTLVLVAAALLTMETHTQVGQEDLDSLFSSSQK